VWRALQDGRRWLVGLAAGLVAYEVGQLLLFPIAELESVVWLLAGIVIAATARPSELRHRIAPRVLAPAFAIVGLVAACAGLLDVAADHRARTAVDTLAAGDTTRAADNAARASSLRPDEVRLHLLAARSAVADERGILTGLDDVERALDRSPHDPIARLTRATLLVDRARATLVPDHIARATDDVDELLAADPYNAQLLMLAGHVARLAGDTDRAENAWRRAEDLAPRSAGPPTALALSLLERGDVAAAREAIGRALARDPQDQDALAVQAQIDATR
jgi:Flp pilus assembly protein TadD